MKDLREYNFGMSMLLKRHFDILFSLAGLLILLPFFVIISLMILLTSKGPVFFRQIRTGRFGKPFTIYKFRTMIHGSEGTTVSVKGDPRITKLGSILRRYKIDELPELLNVLKGDMSLVGPRPDVPEYTMRLTDEQAKILELRPGITGPASIKYKHEEELLNGKPDPQNYNDEVIWPDKVRLNLEYYHNRSFIRGLWLILKTVI